MRLSYSEEPGTEIVPVGERAGLPRSYVVHGHLPGGRLVLEFEVIVTGDGRVGPQGMCVMAADDDDLISPSDVSRLRFDDPLRQAIAEQLYERTDDGKWRRPASPAVVAEVAGKVRRARNEMTDARLRAALDAWDRNGDIADVIHELDCSRPQAYRLVRQAQERFTGSSPTKNTTRRTK